MKKAHAIRKGLLVCWLPGLVSQGVLLRDAMKLAMERVIKGHMKITVRGPLFPSESWPGVPVQA